MTLATLTIWDDPQDPSITVYQRYTQGTGWEDIPGSDATTTGVEGRLDRLRAVNANGAGLWAAPTTVFSSPPAQPTGLRAAPGNGRVTLTWDDPGNPREGVYIASYRYTADGGETWAEIPDSNTTLQGHLTGYTVPNLTNGQTYTFAIQAENEYLAETGFETGTSPPSAAVTATPQGGAPAKPTGLSAAPGDAEATLTWDDPHDASITRYQVKQGAANWADISDSDADTTSHTVASLTNGTAYTFQIRAVNDHDGNSADDPGPASDAVTVRTWRARGPRQPGWGRRRHPGDAHLDGAGQRQRQRRHRVRIHLERGCGHAHLDGRPGRQRFGHRPRRRNRVHRNEPGQQHQLRLRGAGGERQRAGRRHPDAAGRARGSRRAATTGGTEGESGPPGGSAHLVAAGEPEPSGDLLPVPAEHGRGHDLEPGLDGDRRQRRGHGRAPAHRPRQRHHLHLRVAWPEGQHRGTLGAGAGHPERRRRASR